MTVHPIEVLDTAKEHRPVSSIDRHYGGSSLRWRVCEDIDDGGRGVLGWFYRQDIAEQFAEFLRSSTGRPHEVTNCKCRSCLADNPNELATLAFAGMIVCETCGNKRCPHANDHRNECTGSNEPDQPGSAYT